MHITRFRLRNYKSFLDSGDLTLTKGINIITGQNNAGKTALLQALDLKFGNIPHRSTLTVPNVMTTNLGNSKVEIEILMSREELLDFFFNNTDPLLLPKSSIIDPHKLQSTDSFLEYYLPKIPLLNFIFSGGKSIQYADLNILGKGDVNERWHFSINKADKKIKMSGQSTHNKTLNALGIFVTTQIYLFKAERMNIASSNFGTHNELSPDGSNLPEVLNILQGDKIRFERYNSYIRQIFPQIFQISVFPDPNYTGNVKIFVWNEDPKLQRSDLTIPLSECGTGLSQVMAILYVVLTSDTPKIIIVDEPNSFLHPGACRKLIEILKEHPQHQFIIATHSPSTISAANPKTINIVKNENAQSRIESIDISEVNSQQLFLAEIGSKLSDVFGADNILWVEGKTEEICFPKIIEKTDGISLMGTAVLSVINTGDFNTNKSELIFDIYKKLTSGSGLMPSALAFIFDSEKLSKTTKEDLIRKSNGKVIFIKRRMFENYLLNPNAIFHLLKNISEFDSSNLKMEAVSEWLETNKWNKEFISQEIASQDKKEVDWLAHVDGAKLLGKIFSDLTEKLVEYKKTTHSVNLCEWIIENSIEDLKEIQDLLKEILTPNQTN